MNPPKKVAEGRVEIPVKMTCWLDYSLMNGRRAAVDSYPEPFHTLFNSSDRTMTWTYPRERALTLIESTPSPIIGDAESPFFKHF